MSRRRAKRNKRIAAMQEKQRLRNPQINHPEPKVVYTMADILSKAELESLKGVSRAA